MAPFAAAVSVAHTTTRTVNEYHCFLGVFLEQPNRACVVTAFFWGGGDMLQACVCCSVGYCLRLLAGFRLLVTPCS
jgi:hypothetical protein